MKKQLNLKNLLLAVLCFSTFSLSAQNDGGSDVQQHVLKTNVIGYFVGQYQLTYEHALNNNLSLQMSAGLLTGSGSSGDNYDTKRSGLILIPEVHYYFSGNAPKGFYIGAFARYRRANNNLTDFNWVTGGTGTNQDLSRTRKATSIGGGLVLGYQVITAGGFTFDIFAGPQYKSRTDKTDYDNASFNEAPTSGEYDNLGDELFNQKYLDFKAPEKEGMGLRFGFNFGYAF